MLAKVFLSEVRNKRDLMFQEEETIERLRATLDVAGIRYDKERIQSSPSPSRIADTIYKVIEHEEKLEQLKQEYVEFRFTVIDMINKIETEKHRNLLLSVYIDYLSLKNTSIRMGLSYDYTRELHKTALVEFAEMFPHLSC